MGKVFKGGAIFVGAALVGALVAIVMSDPELKNGIKVQGMRAAETIGSLMDSVASLQDRLAQMKKGPTLEDEWAEVEQALVQKTV